MRRGLRPAVWLAALALGALGGGAAGCTAAPAPAGPAAGGVAGGGDGAGAGADRVMVTLKPAPPSMLATATAELARVWGLEVVASWQMASLGEQCVVFRVPGGRPAGRVVARLASDPRVAIAQPVAEFEVLAGYDDPYLHLQHGALELRLEAAHRLATGKGVTVAVVDTGVDLDHPDLRGRIARMGNFVDTRSQTFTSDVHGTAIAGVIAAAAGNDEGIVGVAPGARIFALKACWQQSADSRRAVCNSYTLARAVDAAIVGGAKVLNMSLAGPADPLLGKLVDAALARGIIVVAADSGAGAAPSFPASLEGVVAILASGTDRVPPAGRRGSPGLAAPGVDILSTAPHESYDFFSGSSFAAAHVSGLAALLLERDPALTPQRFAALLRATAKPAKEAGGAPDPGLRLVDACAALAEVAGGGGC